MTDTPNMVLASWARAAFATPAGQSHFYGYYCHSPLSADGRRLLAHHVDFDGREVTAADTAAVGFFDLQDGAWHGLGVTTAFNWQQGAMLQWLGPDFQSRGIYNDQEGDRFVARIVDADTGRSRTVPHAVYDVHPSGRRALGVRFERHYFCRAYHYQGVRNERWHVPIHPEDGILGLDLETGTANLLVRTADIAAYEPTPAMAGASHWLEHLLWNPSGTRFGFLHRFGVGEGFSTRVFTADADGTNLFCLPGHAEYTYTHMGWRDDRTFVNFASRSRPLTQVYAAMVRRPTRLKSLVLGGWRLAKRFMPADFADRRRAESGYALVRDREGVQGLLSAGLLRSDGHPSWTRDGRFMLTDTYTLADGYRRLLLYEARRDQVHEVGRFLSPFNACGYRCDLHPRFSRDERRVILDTAHTGRHEVLVLDLDWKRLGYETPGAEAPRR